VITEPTQPTAPTSPGVSQVSVGILGHGIYLPTPRMSAAEVAERTGGRWSAEAVREKLGFSEKPVPGAEDGTQEMAVRAAEDALARTGVPPDDIDLILCIGEEYKEHPLTTSGIYVQERIGARNAWAIDVQQRCNSTVAALKMASDMLRADAELETALIVGGYRNGDLVDYTDAAASFLYNLGAGAGALLLRKGHERNLVLGTHIVTDGSMARDVGVRYLGTKHPIESLPDEVARRLLAEGNNSLGVFDGEHMKARLGEVSMPNWLRCLDRALDKSGLERSDVDFLNVLHFKPSMYRYLLDELGLSEEQSIYLDRTGHVGQVDPMLVIEEGVATGRLKDGHVMAVLSAGIGYVWGATIVRWG
jgi:3-oxoacyl-[acyl-carrier-protein] synthase-3